MPTWDDDDVDLLPPLPADEEEIEPLDSGEDLTPSWARPAVSRPAPAAPDLDYGAFGLLLVEASVALARLDERLNAAPAAVRAGWLSRAALAEASASLALEGIFIDPRTLRIEDADVYRAGLGENAEAAMVLHLVRVGATRDPRHMFAARRLLAMLRLPKRYRRADYVPDWPVPAGSAPSEMLAILDAVLTRQNVADWQALPPLLGAAAIMTAWHAGRTNEFISGAPGRILAGAWLRKTKALGGNWYMPSIGFRDAPFDWTPEAGISWFRRHLQAVKRGADWGVDLHGSLMAAHSDLLQVCDGVRASSTLPRLATLFIERPALTAATAAKAMEATRRSAAGLIDEIRSRAPGLVTEMTGGNSHRLYAVL